MWRRNRWVCGSSLVACAMLACSCSSGTNEAPTSERPPPWETSSSAPRPVPTIIVSGSARRPPSEDTLLWRTKGGHVGAVSRAKLDQAVSLVAQGDRAGFEQLLATDPGVFVLEEGLEVYVADAGSALGSVVKIRKKGTTAEIWTVREAIAR